MSASLKTEFETAIDGATKADMPNLELAIVAEDCGNPVAVSLIKNCAGMQITIPKSATRKIAIRFILNKFDGSNAMQLARATGISPRNVYEIIEKEDSARQKRRNANGIENSNQGKD
jgi:Mor family transcriptional regulator